MENVHVSLICFIDLKSSVWLCQLCDIRQDDVTKDESEIDIKAAGVLFGHG